MEKASPVYTIENGCQDCYKCVRHCPVKAIRIVGGKASVIPEACVACGECVKVCPQHAKKIRSDLARLRELLASGADVYDDGSYATVNAYNTLSSYSAWDAGSNNVAYNASQPLFANISHKKPPHRQGAGVKDQ